MPDVLDLQGVGKRLGGRPVLRGVDLRVAAGETVALLGPNGSGKSTLLRVAAGQSRPGQGAVRRAQACSYLSQDAPLYAELTAAEHVRWWARLWGLPASDAAAHAALADAGLLALAHRPAGALSRGERQRLALVLALLPDVPRAPLLVLDEPATALDAAAQDWLARRLHARKMAGGAALVALHGEEAARRLADRAMRLAHGRVAADAAGAPSA